MFTFLYGYVNINDEIMMVYLLTPQQEPARVSNMLSNELQWPKNKKNNLAIQLVDQNAINVLVCKH